MSPLRRSARIQQQKRQPCKTKDTGQARQTPKARVTRKDRSARKTQGQEKDRTKSKVYPKPERVGTKPPSPPKPSGAEAIVEQAASPKRRRELDDHDQSQHSKRSRTSQSDGKAPIRYWVLHDSWPSNYLAMSSNNSGKSQKRPRRSPSYSESVRSGSVPQPHSAAAGSHLALQGVILDNSKGRQYLSAKSTALYKDMLTRTYSDKVAPSVGYPLAKLDVMLGRLSFRNETWVVRDLTPLLVPSVEHLTLSGVAGLEHVAEDLNADWKNIKTMGGPAPRPDITVGLDPTAFTRAERKKLDNHKSWESATSFTNLVFFPFLICEVKSSDQTINKASRQAGHGGAIATNAIWQLYRSLEGGHSLDDANHDGAPNVNPVITVEREHLEDDIKDHVEVHAGETVGDEIESRPEKPAENGVVREAADTSVKQLNGEILVFSVAHDNNFVEIYGHFPIFNDGDDRPSIYRHLIDSQALSGDAETRARRVRDFVLDIYFTFSKTHLERIQKALRMMPEPQIDLQDAIHAGQEIATTMGPPSQSASQMRENVLENQIEDLRALKTSMEAEKKNMEADRKTMEAERQNMQAQISQLLATVNHLVMKSAA